MPNDLKVYVGYDSREDIAWQVCRHSLVRHTRAPLNVFPIKQKCVRQLGLYTRPVDAPASTEFSLTRFLTPYLAAHDGWTIFVDCDFVFTVDVRSILKELDPAKGLYVVQHDYIPRHQVKMDGKAQTTYPRKNWSSFMVFNGSNPLVRKLTPRVVNTQAPSFLHRFSWIPDEFIGSLPIAWNFLVGEYPEPKKTPHAIHYTNGGPWFEHWRDVSYGDVWRGEHDRYLAWHRERGQASEEARGR